MPVKIDMSSIEFSAINQMAKDYEILYRALELILKEDYVPYTMKRIAESALDEVQTRPKSNN